MPSLNAPLLCSAPMAGFTNFAFRELLRMLGGVDLIATEMVSARAFVEMEKRELNEPSRLWGVPDEQQPLCVQIWDNDPETLSELARKLAFDYKVSVIDLNFGCPAKQIARRSESGSFLLQFPDRIGTIVQKVIQTVNGRCEVSAKIRLGKTRDTINAVDVAQAVEDAGAARLIVHGRTAADMYRGEANWDEIAKIKPKLKTIQLIGNGDIRNVENALFRLQHFPVDGIMIGRAAVAQPWIFRDIKRALRGESEEQPEPPNDLPILPLITKLYETLRQQFEESTAILILQKIVCQFVAGRSGARKFRNELCTVKEKTAFFQLVQDFFANP